MVKPGQALKSHNKHMFKMLPQKGMYYDLWEPDQDEGKNNKSRNDRRILPPKMSTKIMMKFNHKHKQAGTQPTRDAFDREVAELFNKANEAVRSAGYNGKDASYDSVFWRVPKMGTFLETASDNTASRFAAKMLQAREIGLEKQGGAREYDCETAKAIDGFNRSILVASLASSGAEALASDKPCTEETNFSMASYTNMIEQFDNSDDTDASESGCEPIDNKKVPTDDEAPAAKRVKAEKPLPTHGEAPPSFGLELGNTPLTIRTREPEEANGANETASNEPAMPPTNNGEAAPYVAPADNHDWSAEMDLDFDENWYWANKRTMPASYYDELIAKDYSAEEIEMDYDMDD
ncbi:hypothetical protein DHEL01_v210251 [Diaporthe helianthi]|uniref:Uncharacterized protein n=1 Tax=Diaporthe helianthi TaxID=158607 RepID=A0A2P5HM93_DIAHE|nr:hypothetical protein DHEL01_v210251 [Diaporthe helianthi]